MPYVWEIGQRILRPHSISKNEFTSEVGGEYKIFSITPKPLDLESYL